MTRHRVVLWQHTPKEIPVRRFHLVPTTRPSPIRGWAYLRWLHRSWLVRDPLRFLPGIYEGRIG